MKIKIRGGTAQAGENLCDTCQWSLIVKGLSGRTLHKCEWLDVSIREPIVECGKYNDKRQPTLMSMEKIAWHVSADPKNPVGFRPPEKPKEEGSLWLKEYNDEDI
jgi:hypothetical protein